MANPVQFGPFAQLNRGASVLLLQALQAGPSAKYGDSISMYGVWVAVGYCNSPSGAPQVEIFQRDLGGTNNWGRFTVLNSPQGGNTNILFGFSVSMFGNTLAVGAPNNVDMGTPSYVYIYTYNGTLWSLNTTLTSSGTDEQFGSSVSLVSGFLVVGAPEANRVEIFALTNGIWTSNGNLPTGVLVASLLRFGTSVSADNQTHCVVVGAPQTNKDGANLDEGVAIVFCNNVIGDWTNADHFLLPWDPYSLCVASDTSAAVGIGTSVAIDGTTVVVGAPLCNKPNIGSPAGSATVWERPSLTSNTWTMTRELYGASYIYQFGQKYFGQAVAIQGDYIIVGAPAVSPSGSVEAFYRYSGDNSIQSWGRVGALVPNPAPGGTNPKIGNAVTLYDIYVAFMAPEAEVGAPGEGYVFKRFQCPPGTKLGGSTATSLTCTSCGLTGTTTYFNSNSTCDPCGPGYYNGTIAGVWQCIKCSPGYYQNLVGQYSCNPCLPPLYQGVQGQPACQTCPVGQFANTTAQSQCYQCAPGQYANTTGLSRCFDCKIGYYNPWGGQSQCVGCYAGAFTNFTGATICTWCTYGFYNPNTTQTSCAACPTGTSTGYPAGIGRTTCTQCVPGTYANTTGSKCNPCPLGYFNNATGAGTCQPCIAGYSTDLPGQIQCRLCGFGSYGNLTGQAGCTPCPPGTYSQIAGQTNVTGCQSCRAGQFSGPLGSSTCTDCSRYTFTAQPTTQWCTICPSGSTNDGQGLTSCYCLGGYQLPLNVSNTSLASPSLCARCEDSFACAFCNPSGQCYCKAGYMMNARYMCSPCPGYSNCSTCSYSGCVCNAGFTVGPDGFSCIQCPTGAVCNGGNSMPTAAPGYWQSSSTSGFQTCDPPARCPGGALQTCTQYNTGYLCADCVVGSYQDRFTGICMPCPPSGVVAILMIVFIVGIEILLLYTIRSAYLQVSSFGSFIIAFCWAQLYGLLYEYPIAWGQTEQWVIRLISIADFNIDFFYPECATQVQYFQAQSYSDVWYYKMLMPILLFAALGVNCTVLAIIWILFKRSALVKMIRALIQSFFVVALMLFTPYMVMALDGLRCLPSDIAGRTDRWQFDYDVLCGDSTQTAMASHALSALVLYGVIVFVTTLLYLLWCMRGTQVQRQRVPKVEMDGTVGPDGQKEQMGNSHSRMLADGNDEGGDATQMEKVPSIPGVPMGEDDAEVVETDGPSGEYAPPTDPDGKGAAGAGDPQMLYVPQELYTPPNAAALERAGQAAGLLTRRFSPARYLWSVVMTVRHTLVYLAPFVVFAIAPTLTIQIRVIVHMIALVLSLNLVCFFNGYAIGGMKKLEIITTFCLILITVICILNAAGLLSQVPAVLSSLTPIFCVATLVYCIYFIVKHCILVKRSDQKKAERKKAMEEMAASSANAGDAAVEFEEVPAYSENAGQAPPQAPGDEQSNWL